jgi:hypothetical protein
VSERREARDTPLCLEPDERPSGRLCDACLRQAPRSRLIGAWPPGSKPRGDFSPDAGLESWNVLRELDLSLREEVQLASARVSLECDVLLSPHVLDWPHWGTLCSMEAPLADRCSGTACACCGKTLRRETD